MGDTTYDLRCVDCSFETAVEGDSDEALAVADDHREQYGNGYTDHFVNLELTV